MIVDESTNDISLRQSALVNMKTFLEKSWKGRKGEVLEISSLEK
jgi:hypothetical protein